MLTIGEFSKTCMVTVKALRYYSKIGLLIPAHTDRFTGYRFYDESQIAKMLLILKLKDYGFKLSEIKQILDEKEKEVLLSKLIKQKSMLILRSEMLMKTVSEMEKHIEIFERTGDIMSYQNHYEVKVKNTEDTPIFSIRKTISIAEYPKCIEDLIQKGKENNIDDSGMGLTIYHDKEFDPESNDTEFATIVHDTAQSTRVLKGNKCAMVTHTGDYSNLGEAYSAVVKWIKENGYEICDSPYDVYVKSGFNNCPPEEWITEIYFPIK